MNNDNKGGYPETVLFFLFATVFMGYWIITAYRGGVPPFILVFGGFTLTGAAAGFINSFKSYCKGRREKENLPDEKWEKTYSGEDRIVYRKGNMTFRMNGNPLIILLAGLYPVWVLYRRMRNGSFNRRTYTPFLLFLISLAAAVSVISAVKVVRERKAEKWEWLMKDDTYPEDEN